MGDTDRLQTYIDTWWTTVTDNLALLRSLDADDWDRPTDLPGWNVRYVAAHLAHLESVLAGLPQDDVDVPDLPHITNPMGQFTESGPLARADWSTDQIIDELETAATKRRADLLALMPIEPTEPGDGFAGFIGWTWETLLSNRPIDQWMHEQDIRRAVGRPGGFDSPAAEHTVGVYLRGFPFVLGKRVAPPAGTVAVLDVTAQGSIAATIGDDGRAKVLDERPDEADVSLTMDPETFIILSGGRRQPADVSVEVTGDAALADAILTNLGVTP